MAVCPPLPVVAEPLGQDDIEGHGKAKEEAAHAARSERGCQASSCHDRNEGRGQIMTLGEGRRGCRHDHNQHREAPCQPPDSGDHTAVSDPQKRRTRQGHCRSQAPCREHPNKQHLDLRQAQGATPEGPLSARPGQRVQQHRPEVGQEQQPCRQRTQRGGGPIQQEAGPGQEWQRRGKSGAVGFQDPPLHLIEQRAVLRLSGAGVLELLLEPAAVQLACGRVRRQVATRMQTASATGSTPGTVEDAAQRLVEGRWLQSQKDVRLIAREDCGCSNAWHCSNCSLDGFQVHKNATALRKRVRTAAVPETATRHAPKPVLRPEVAPALDPGVRLLVVRPRADAAVGAHVARGDRGTGQQQLPRLADGRQLAVLLDQQHVQLRQWLEQVLLLQVDGVVASAAVRVQRQPVLRGNEQLEYGAPLPPLPRELGGQFLAPRDDHAEAGGLGARPARIGAPQLRRHRAQHGDAVLRHGRGEPVHARRRGNEHGAGAKGQGDVELPEGSGAPVCGRVLQDPVAGGDLPLEDFAVVGHFPERHGVRHDDALAILGGPTSVGVHQDALGAWGGSGTDASNRPASSGHDCPQLCHLEEHALGRQSRHDHFGVPIDDSGQRPELASCSRCSVAFGSLVGHVLAHGRDGQTHAPTREAERIPSAASWQHQGQGPRRLRRPGTPRRRSGARDAPGLQGRDGPQRCVAELAVRPHARAVLRSRCLRARGRERVKDAVEAFHPVPAEAPQRTGSGGPFPP
mmetsp:Transcript_88293/g.279335  ORF Transcript_88293/g.279335 Transcript_88293/m.279335 type:complete len:743 (+) Transcript_88293:2354-4582(+)